MKLWIVLLSIPLFFLSCSQIDPTTALIDALQFNDLDEVQNAIHDGADVNFVFNNKTPLILAVENENKEIIACLLQSGANANYVHFEKTIYTGYPTHYYSAMQLAVGSGNITIVNMLLDAGADLYSYVTIREDNVGRPLPTPTICALSSPLSIAAGNGDLEMLRFLLDHGGEPNLKPLDGRMPIYAAAVEGHLYCIELLLKRGADASTALEAAVDGGKIEIADHLIANGAITHAGTMTIQAILNSASGSGNLELLKRLVENGADIQRRIKEEPELIKDIVSNPMVAAANRGHLEIIEYLVEQGFPIDIKMVNSTEGTPFASAIYNGHAEVAAYLLQHGADPYFMDEYGKTSLHYAIEKDCVEAAKLLMETDINIDYPSHNKYQSPLMFAVFSGYPDIAELLIGKGAKINRIDGSGQTSLDYAIHYDDKEMIEILKKHGAKTAGEMKHEK